jgi:P pilus assembly chaperone PapD
MTAPLPYASRRTSAHRGARASFASCVAMLGLVVAPRAAHAQLTVDALELFVTASSARTVRTVSVRNDGAERVQATVRVEDWERDEHGTNRFLALGSHANSCGEAIEVFPQSVALDPGESTVLRVAVDSTASRCWGVVFLEHRATEAVTGRQLSYQVRTGVKVYVDAANAVRDGLIEQLTITEATAEDALRAATAAGPSATPRSLGEPLVQLGFRNAGDVQLLVGGHVEVRREDNSVAHRAPLEAVPVLPGARRLVSAALPALPRGRYIVLTLLDFGGSELVAGQLEYEVR